MLLDEEHFCDEPDSGAGARGALPGLNLRRHLAEPGMAFRQVKQKVPDRIVLAGRQTERAMAAHMGLQALHLGARQRLLHDGQRRARAVAALGNVLARPTHGKAM